MYLDRGANHIKKHKNTSILCITGKVAAGKFYELILI